MPRISLTHPLPRSSCAPSFLPEHVDGSLLSTLLRPGTAVGSRAFSMTLLLLLTVVSIRSVSPPCSPFLSIFLYPLSLSLCLPPRQLQQMTVYTESGSAPSFCLLKGRFSSPLLAKVYSRWVRTWAHLSTTGRGSGILLERHLKTTETNVVPDHRNKGHQQLKIGRRDKSQWGYKQTTSILGG